jgi:Tripartite tricarboxylate transporter TctB family
MHRNQERSGEGVRFMKTSNKRSQGDFAVGVVILLVSLGALIASIRMPFYAKGLRGLFGSPGLTPGILAFGLVLMSAALVYQSRAAAKPTISMTAIARQWRVALFFVIGALYAYLMPIIGFTIVTFGALFSFQVIYGQRRRPKYLLIALVFSALLAVGIKFVFKHFFLVPLPGELV